ncbi:pancreatic triacylglycerol lipase-like [Dermacentor albipictus]|uniref:pancreatic triacylglycerol lipase-like n=1 Tax=Dermacentor albipictus TaxID=60249 RepID=UPI0038FBEAB4
MTCYPGNDLPFHVMRNSLATLIKTLFWTVAASAISNKSRTGQPEQKCFKELGCFKMAGPFFHEIYRPINFYPEEREHIDTRFILYSRENSMRGELLKWSSTPAEVASSTTFKASRPTKVLIHGWVDTVFFGAWLKKMTTAFLMVGDFNVIIVDWLGGNALPYTQATANTRVVGAEIALLVNKLEKAFGAKRETFHILGHSLGSHVAGYAGERLPGLGRITGLDPSDPYFQHMPKEVRLDPTDARLVDVLHTDGASVFDIYKAEGLGMYQPAGHLDFYPNGGIKMPGCSTNSRILITLTKGAIEAARSVVCNHERAIDYFLDSITERECTSLAFACISFETFRSGRCSDCGNNGRLCARMGMHADSWRPVDNTSVQMYLHTMAEAPFCAFPFFVNIVLWRTEQIFATGYFVLILDGTRGRAVIKINKEPLRLFGAVKNEFVVKTDTYIGDLQAASFRYTSSRFFFFRSNMLLRHVEVLPMNEPVRTHERRSKMKTFCYYNKTGIPSGEEVKLTPCKL